MLQDGVEGRVQDFPGVLQFGLGQEFGIAGIIGDEQISFLIFIPHSLKDRDSSLGFKLYG